MTFADTATTLSLTNAQLLELTQNPQFATALTSNSDGLIADMTFDDTAVTAFAATMAEVAAAGWHVDFATSLAATDWATLAATTPGPFSLATGSDALFDLVDS